MGAAGGLVPLSYAEASKVGHFQSLVQWILFFAPALKRRIEYENMASAGPAIPTSVTGTIRSFVLPPCLLKPSDLRRLFRLLEVKAREAAERQIASLTLQPGQTQQHLDQVKENVRGLLSLVVRLQTKSGAWINATIADPLEDENLPDGTTRIEFDSAFLFRSQFNNLAPNNSFLLTVDLTRPSVLDLESVPVQNVSRANISGIDSTWANSLCDELATFFRERQNNRGWLHSPQSYNALLFPIGFPLSFWVVNHLDKLIQRRFSPALALSVAIDVYVVLMALFLFRVTFNYARWIFPKVEIDAPRQHIAVGHRVVISTIGLMIASVLVKAILKLFGIG